MSGTCIGHIMGVSVRPCLGYGISIEMKASCKTMSGTWHWHGYVRVSVRPCLGHGIDLTAAKAARGLSPTSEKPATLSSEAFARPCPNDHMGVLPIHTGVCPVLKVIFLVLVKGPELVPSGFQEALCKIMVPKFRGRLNHEHLCLTLTPPSVLGCPEDASGLNKSIPYPVRDGLYQFLVDSSIPSDTVPSIHNTGIQDCSSTDDVFTLWHKRLGHPSTAVVKLVLDKCQIVSNRKCLNNVCITCQKGKSHKLLFSNSTIEYMELFELVVSGMWGSAPVACGGNLYYVSFVDMCSRYNWVYLIKRKSQAVKCFFQFHKMVVTQFGKNIKKFQSDWGGEFRAFTSVLTSHGILHHLSCPHTLEQNRVTERKHRHIVETDLTLLAQANLPIDYWGYAFCSAVHLINHLPIPVLKGQSPYQTLHGRKPTYQHLRPLFNRLPVFPHMFFSFDHPLSDPPQNPVVPLSHPLLYLCLLLQAAIPCSLYWSVQAEFDALLPNSTWELVPLPPGQKAIRCKWLFKTKKNPDGTVDRRKAWLVAKCCSQVPRCDFKETFSPVVKPATIWTILSVVVPNRWQLHQVDVNNAFLNGDLTDEMFIQQPPGYVQYGQNGEPLQLHNEFSLKDMGDLHYFLGIEVSRSSTGSLHLFQRKYIRDLLDRCSLANAKSVHTLMVSSSILSKDEDDRLNDPTEYKTLVDALQYVVLTQPNIAYAVNCVC
ncbi:hypothetical protein CXB51_004883 [Gossypium anomalum]|uniref:Integrase catalytic domain-containing protein n=1 Tax=Gossypium anomalum TaxID=47600 RepID=A0A8J5Z0C2_9ROSI|nr:hypothetical protein CXB51_004883 [Gossypium anomalum]